MKGVQSLVCSFYPSSEKNTLCMFRLRRCVGNYPLANVQEACVGGQVFVDLEIFSGRSQRAKMMLSFPSHVLIGYYVIDKK